MSAVPSSAPSDTVQVAMMLRLRRETQDLHRQIERNPGFGSLMARGLALADYTTVLAAIREFHAVMEPAIAKATAALPAAAMLRSRFRLGLLDLDLRHLGHLDQAVPVPACRPVFDPPTTPAAGLGCLYVLEGSRRGGAVIAKLLSSRLGLCSRSGAAFFGSGADPAVEEGWQILTAAIAAEAVVPDSSSADAIVQAARQTFQALDLWVADVWESPLLVGARRTPALAQDTHHA